MGVKMNIAEKREIVMKYCTDCDRCKLKVGGWDKMFVWSKCLDINQASEKDLDRAIELINGDSVKVIDNINRPAHYTDGKIEVIDFIEDKKLGFCLGNAIKYISRAGKKDPTKAVEDLKKAAWYINRRIKELEEA
jgi:hypothetical protein